MRKIYKYQIPIIDEFEIEMPIEHETLCVQNQRSVPCIWVIADPEDVKKRVKFRIHGTGHPIDEEEYYDKYAYVGTFQQLDGDLVWHLFEIWEN